jgi:hypothetical protein
MLKTAVDAEVTVLYDVGLGSCKLLLALASTLILGSEFHRTHVCISLSHNSGSHVTLMVCSLVYRFKYFGATCCLHLPDRGVIILRGWNR